MYFERKEIDLGYFDNYKIGKLLKLDVFFFNKYVLSYENLEEIYRFKLF